jgi:hypothetical protein
MSEETIKLTERQQEVLDYVRRCGPVGSGYDGSVLRVLAKKGLVNQHHNQAPGYVYYTWTVAK